MSNTNHVFVGLPALIKNAAASDPIVSAGDNHISGIGFFDAITGGTTNRNDLGTNFRNTNFLAVVGTTVYFYSGANVSNPDWTDAANWTTLSSPDLSTLIANNASSITSNSGAISTIQTSVTANATSIGVNATGVANNASSISTSAGDITTLQTNLAQEITDRSSGDTALQSQISSNDGDIVSLNSSVSTNTSSISANGVLITTNAAAITSNDADIATLQGTVGGIATNTAAIASNATAIATNLASISSNAGSITANDADITQLTTDLASEVSARATAISGLQTQVTANNASNTGPVTVHNDVTSAGSGAIITSVERTKLNGIETAATADQTGAEIKTAYEAETKAFTDAQFDKLALIQASATANSTDATLLDRANHTGTQTAATISNFDAEVSNNTSVAANTLKTSFPGFGTSGGTALEGDTALLQLGTSSTTALAGDTTTITAGQASAIIANTAKTGITSGQANAITANTAKVTFPGFGTTAGTALEGDTTLYSQTTLVPTTGSNVVANAASSTVSLTSSDGSVTITGSTGTLNFAASGGGGSSTQRTLTLPTANNDWTGDVVTFGSLAGGGSFTQGKLYVFRNGAWNEAYGTGASTAAGMLGIALEQNTTKMLTRGTFQSSNFSFTTSNTLYVSANQGGSGRFMDSIPASPASGTIIRICGYVINGVSNQIFFDPSKDFITLV